MNRFLMLIMFLLASTIAAVALAAKPAESNGQFAELNCPLQSGPKVNLDLTPKETNNGQEARA